MAVAQSLSRPIRTAVQLGAAAIVVEFFDAFFLDFTDRQYAALLALVTLVLGWLQVIVEDRAGKAFLRTPSPPEPPAPVVSERGVWDAPGVLVALACVVIVIVGLVWLIQNLG